MSWIEELATTMAPIDIDGLTHFLFDDTDLGDKTSGEIGYSLFDLGEADVVAEFAQAMAVLLRRESQLAVDDLRNAARKAHAVLRCKGMAVLS